MNNKIVPTYEHDCDRCEFVTSAAILGRVVDIYRNCSPLDENEYISEGSDYATTFNRKDYPENHRYHSGYDGNPKKTILSLNQYICEKVDELCKEIYSDKV